MTPIFLFFTFTIKVIISLSFLFFLVSRVPVK